MTQSWGTGKIRSFFFILDVFPSVDKLCLQHTVWRCYSNSMAGWKCDDTITKSNNLQVVALDCICVNYRVFCVFTLPGALVIVFNQCLL